MQSLSVKLVFESSIKERADCTYAKTVTTLKGGSAAVVAGVLTRPVEVVATLVVVVVQSIATLAVVAVF